MAKVLEALQRDMEQETEARQAESQMRVTAQERCAAAEEQASKQEWEYNQAATALQRKVGSPHACPSQIITCLHSQSTCAAVQSGC